MGEEMSTYVPPYSSARPMVIGRASHRHGWFRRLRTRAAAWLATCVDHYEAAAMYEELHRLSDAELRRRGLDRPSLACDILRDCDRGGRDLQGWPACRIAVVRQRG